MARKCNDCAHYDGDYCVVKVPIWAQEFYRLVIEAIDQYRAAYTVGAEAEECQTFKAKET